MKTMELKNGNATYRITFLELMNGCRIADNCPNYHKVRLVKLDEADKVITEGQSWMLPDLSVQRKTTNGLYIQYE